MVVMLQIVRSIYIFFAKDTHEGLRKSEKVYRILFHDWTDEKNTNNYHIPHGHEFVKHFVARCLVDILMHFGPIKLQ